jgi:hypothetical protein
VDLSAIVEAIRSRRIQITRHAALEARKDDLEIEAVTASVLKGERIADYPDDRPFPSCLVLGYAEGRPVHSVWAFDATTKIAVLITVYRPDPARWSTDFRRRRTE